MSRGNAASSVGLSPLAALCRVLARHAQARPARSRQSRDVERARARSLRLREVGAARACPRCASRRSRDVKRLRRSPRSGRAGRDRSRWKPERPGANSLWLLPSGPDQVGESTVRPTSGYAYASGFATQQYQIAI